MVSHPELGSDPPIGSNWESGCDTYAQAGGNGNTSSAQPDSNSRPANPVLNLDLFSGPGLCDLFAKY